MTFGEERPAERLFKAALSLEAGERNQFLARAAGDDHELLEAVQLLLQGYEEAGGDAEQLSIGSAPSARHRWAETTETPGLQVGPFTLVRCLGAGGMGTVWEAEQAKPVQRRVALKVIKVGMDTRDVVARFERERQSLAVMNHPNIARVFEAGATSLGRPYFAMELVEGEPLTDFCHRRTLGIRDRVRLFIKVCSAIEHAHQKGVIHRDLKPSNLLVDREGVPKVIDFGVAKATHEGSHPLLTLQSQRLGTPAYMSPEQAAGEGVDIDTRSDVYSLGVVLYELLSGSLPFSPERFTKATPAELARILQDEEPQRPSTRAAGLRPEQESREARRLLHGDLDWIIMQALAKERERRYPSAAALAEDLRRYLNGELVSAVPPTLAYRCRKFMSKNRGAVLAAALVIGALTTGLAVSLIQADRAERARREAVVTVADLYARSGLAAAEDGHEARSTLWFARAAVTAEADPARVAANRLRTAAWRQQVIPTVRAFETGFRFTDRLHWHPNGRVLLAISRDRTSRVWDLQAEAFWSPGHAQELHDAIWDPEGGRLAASSGHDVVVLAFPSGKEVHRIVEGEGALAWSPDGTWLAVGGRGGLLWNAESGETIPFGSSIPDVSACRFDPTGRLLLLECHDRVGVCEVAAPSRFLFPPVPLVAANARFLGDSGQHFYLRGERGIEVRDAATGEVRESYSPERSDLVPVPSLASRNGRFIACQSMPVIDRSRQRFAAFPQHQNIFRSFAFHPDGSRLASGGYDNALKLWSLPDGAFLGEIGRIRYPILGLAFSPDGSLLASAEEGLVRVWRIDRPPSWRRVVDTTSLICFSPDDAHFALAGLTRHDSSVRTTGIFDSRTGAPAGPEIVPGGRITDAAFAPHGKWLALAVSTTPHRLQTELRDDNAGSIQLWDPIRGERLEDPIKLPSEPRALAIHRSGKWIGVYGAGGEGLEIEVASRTVRTLFPGVRYVPPDATLNNGRCRYSEDGRYFLAWGTYQQVHFWDRENERELTAPERHNWNAFDLDLHDGVTAAAVVADQTRIEFFDLAAGKPARLPILITNWPLRARFDPTGDLLLTAGAGKLANVWDWRDGIKIGPALPHDDQIMAGEFLPGTPWVVTGGHDGMVRFWDPRTAMLVRPALSLGGTILSLDFPAHHKSLFASTSEGVVLIDLEAVLPNPELPPHAAALLSEIDSGAEVHAGGGLVWLSTAEWVARWRHFRAAYPEFSGHQLPPE